MMKGVFSFLLFFIAVVNLNADMLYTDEYMARTGIINKVIDTGYHNRVSGRTLLHWHGRIKHMEPIYFSGSSIRNESWATIDEIKDIIGSKGSGVRYISIIGHCSSAPDMDHSVRLNFWSAMWQKLGETENLNYDKAVQMVNERISIIYEELKSIGIDTKKIYTENRLDRDLISSEATIEGRRKNNRVDVTIYYAR